MIGNAVKLTVDCAFASLTAPLPIELSSNCEFAMLTAEMPDKLRTNCNIANKLPTTASICWQISREGVGGV